LVGDHFDEHPVTHAGMTDVRFDLFDFHCEELAILRIQLRLELNVE
jgi:hypothetical protein